jgi:hypothetical protein
MATPQQILDAAAAGGKKTVTDGTETESHSLTELMEYANQAAAVTALDGGNGHGGPRSGWGACLRPAVVRLPAAMDGRVPT